VRFSIVATLVLFSSLAMAQSNSGAKAIHANGASASVFTFNNDINVFLNVGRGTDSPVGGQGTFLVFTTFSFTPDASISTFGNGFVPNEVLRGDSTAHLTLNVDTSQLTSFQTTTCTFTFSTFTTSCASGPVGIIDLEWQQDGAFNTHSIATTQQNFGQFSLQSHGESDFSSASVNGSVLGMPLVNGSGESGVNHNTTLTLIKNF